LSEDQSLTNISKLERGYFIVVLFLLSGALLPALLGAPLPETLAANVGTLKEIPLQEGDIVKQAIFGIIYASFGILLLWRFPARVLLLNIPLLLLFAWCFVSAFWSWSPDMALRRVFGLFGCVVMAAYISLRCDTSTFLSILRAVTLAVFLVSGVVIVVAPHLAFHPDVSGEFGLRGAFPQKNLLGAFCNLSALSLLCRILEFQYASRAHKAFDGFLLLTCIVVLILSSSATAVVGLCASILVVVLTRIANKNPGLVFAFVPAVLCMFIAIILLFAADLNSLTPLLGRDATLTGRTPIWEFAIEMIRQQPLMGYGYGTFWSGADAPGAAYWHRTHFFVIHAHNLWIQMLLDAGVVSLVLLMMMIVQACVRISSLTGRVGLPFLSWHAAILSYILTCSMSEVLVWQPNDLFTVLLCYVVLRVTIEYRLNRAQLAESYSVHFQFGRPSA
jgi:exopolysaccharide production protein ExoQ